MNIKMKTNVFRGCFAVFAILVVGLVFCNNTLAVGVSDLDSFRNCLSMTGEVCKLSGDILRGENEEETILSVGGDDLTIDLNGHKLQYPLNIQSKVLLTDFVGGGEIIAENNNGVELGQDSDVVIDGVKITSINRGAIRAGRKAKLVVEGGEFIGNNVAISTGNPCSEQVIINGGTFMGGFSNSCSKRFEIKDGTFNGDNSSLYTYGTTVIDGGDFNGGLWMTDNMKFVDSSGDAVSGTFTINDGSFHSDGSSGLRIARHYDGEDEKYHDKYSILINGGVFEGKENGLWIECVNGGRCTKNDFLELKGGRFKGSMETSSSWGKKGAIFLQTKSPDLTVNDFVASDYELSPSDLLWSDAMEDSYGYYSYTNSDDVMVVKKGADTNTDDDGADANANDSGVDTNIDDNSDDDSVKVPNTGSNVRNEAELTPVLSVVGGILTILAFAGVCKCRKDRLKNRVRFSKK